MKTINIFLIILLEIMFVNQLFSQVIQDENKIYFHDFVPDILLRYQFDTLKIDINQDLVQDIAFFLSSSSGGTYCYVKSINPNCQYAFFPTSDYCSDFLTCDSLRWRTTGLAWIEYYYQDKLAIRFSINNQYYYGWLRGYQIYSETFSFYVDKYAFCTIPGYPLLWGQTTLTGVIGNVTNPSVWAYYDPATTQIYVQAIKTIKNVKLVNLNGVVVSALNNVNSCVAVFSTSGLPAGVYLVVVTFSDRSIQTIKVLLG